MPLRFGEVLTVQGGARGVGDGGAGAVQLAADVRPVQPYRALGGAGADCGPRERHPSFGAQLVDVQCRLRRIGQQASPQ